MNSTENHIRALDTLRALRCALDALDVRGDSVFGSFMYGIDAALQHPEWAMALRTVLITGAERVDEHNQGIRREVDALVNAVTLRQET